MKLPKPLRKLAKKSESKERKSLKSVKHKISNSEHSYYKKGIKKNAKEFYKAQVKEQGRYS